MPTESLNNIQQPTDVELTSTSKRTFIYIVVSFVLPVLLAFLVLKQGWFTAGVTNKGELLMPTRQLNEQLNTFGQGKWRLIYQVPVTCDALCENSLYTLQQVRLALGRKLDRVETYILFQSSSSNAHSYTASVVVPVEDSAYSFNHDQPQALYIADPLGNVMMRYTMSSDKKQAIMVGRDVLKDLSKMLKLSKVG